ncbi:hypothetical protein EDD11_002577 [Mortierella claussenii]|nr:hypothetical protein EDD11_002577 [Mortierella claussenii]
MRGASHSEEDGQAVYRKRGLGGELDTSQSNVSPNSNMTVGQTDTVTMAQEDRAHAIEVSAHVDSHQSNSNNTINNNRLDNVDDDTAEELTLMEERVQQSVQKLMASSGVSDERDQAQQQRQGHEYGREQSVEEEVNVDSEEAIIRRKLEAEMEAELLDYEESLFDEVVQRAAEEQPSDTLLEELAGDYVGPLTTLDELEERSWMYETPRIARLERVFASRW